MADDRAERLELELAEERARCRRLEQALAQFQREEDQSLVDQANRHRQQLVDQANVHRMMMNRQADKYVEAAMGQADRHREAVTHLIEQRRKAMERLISSYRVQGSMRLNQQSQADGPPKKKRGRPKKAMAPSVPVEQQAPVPTVDATGVWTAQPVLPKKRGRPPTQKQTDLPRPPAEQQTPVPASDATGQSEDRNLAESEYYQSFNQWLENRRRSQEKEKVSASAGALPQYLPRSSSNPGSSIYATDQAFKDRLAMALAMREAQN